MKKFIEKRGLVFVGDIHGELKKLVHTLTIGKDLRNTDIVVCGDFGVGFITESGLGELYKAVEKRLSEWDLTIWAVRGNHDDPGYFDGLHDYPRLKFVKDHEVITLGDGITIYPIGGAVSTDSEWRIKKNADFERHGSSRKVWWPGEEVVQQRKDLPRKVDVVVSHEAPIVFEPVVVRDSGLDPDTWQKISESRNYLGWVLGEINTRYWFHGHYHQSTSGNYGEVLYRGLDIDELFMFPENYERTKY